MTSKSPAPKSKAVANRSAAKPTSVATRAAPKRSKSTTTTPLAPAPTGSKQSQLIHLLSSGAGATLQQMTTLTGWQPHTVRGTISGILRKKLGLQVICSPHPESGKGVYRITGTGA
ncbi:MAG: DUF3489 domain-containing protein [Rhodocyclaceae bacterium]|nr:MAG: DUF3489 domain-containing protein [Rhodocyclaceae bacterium]